MSGPGIVAIRQHCCTKASLSGGEPGISPSHCCNIPHQSVVSMTNVGQAATAELAAAASAAAPGRLARLLGVVAVALALLSALVTFLVLANLTPDRADPRGRDRASCVGNAATVLLLLGIIGWEIWRVVQARRRGRAGSRLHVRIVALFSIIAAVPAILVAVVASVTLDRGLDRLFSEQTQAHDPEFADRGRRPICASNAGSCAPTPSRWRSSSRAPSRCSIRIATEFHQFVNARPRVRGLPRDHAVRPRRQRDRAGRHQGRRPDLHHAVAAGARHHRRERAADRHVPRATPCRRADQAARL